MGSGGKWREVRDRGRVGRSWQSRNGSRKLSGVREKADEVCWGSGEQSVRYAAELFWANGVDMRCEKEREKPLLNVCVGVL